MYISNLNHEPWTSAKVHAKLQNGWSHQDEELVEQWSLANGTRLDGSLNHLQGSLNHPKKVTSRIARPQGQTTQPREVSTKALLTHLQGKAVHAPFQHLTATWIFGSDELSFSKTNMMFLRNSSVPQFDFPADVLRLKKMKKQCGQKHLEKGWDHGSSFFFRSGWKKSSDLAGFADLEPLVKVKRSTWRGSTMIQCRVATFQCSFLEQLFEEKKIMFTKNLRFTG